jgi:hypothetical protein
LKIVQRVLLGCAPAVSASKSSQSGRVAQPPGPPPVPEDVEVDVVVDVDEEVVVALALVLLVVVLPDDDGPVDDDVVVVCSTAPPVPPVLPLLVVPPLEDVPHAMQRQIEAPNAIREPDRPIKPSMILLRSPRATLPMRGMLHEIRSA